MADIATFTPSVTLSSGTPNWTIIESDGTQYTYTTASISHTRTAAGAFKVYLTPENINGFDFRSDGVISSIGEANFDLVTLTGSFFFQGNSGMGGDILGIPVGGSNYNLASTGISGDVSGLPTGATAYNFSSTAVSGDVSGLPTGATSYTFSSTAVSGDVSGLPTGATIYQFISTAVSGDVSGIPNGATRYDFGSSSVTGLLSGIPTGTGATVYNFGSTAVSGNVSGLPTGGASYSFGSSGASGSVSGIPSSATFAIFSNTSVTAGSIAHLVSIESVQLQDNSWTQGDVDSVILSVYNARASYTDASPVMNISGTNASPSGIYQDATPPTTGKEYIYKLENDPDLEGFNTWVITYS